MKRYLWPRSPLAWVVIAAVIFLVLGTVVPPLYNNQTRPLAFDQNINTVTAPSAGVWMEAPEFIAGAKASGDSKDPQCQEKQAPMWCYLHHDLLTIERNTTTSEVAEDDALANSDSLSRLLAGNTPLAQITEHSVLNRESTYPVAAPKDKWDFVLPALDTGMARTDFERDGINYFFPSGTEQRSYPFFDLATQSSTAVDFTTMERLDGIPTYSFHHDIQPISLADMRKSITAEVDTGTGDKQLAAKDFRISGPAKRFYDAESRELLGLDATDRVTVEPFYTIGRDISVEPTTGTMVDLRENIKIFFAADEKQAGTMVANDDTEDRSIFAADLRWSDETRAERLNEVRPVIRTIRALMVVGWAGKAIGVGLLLCAAYMYMRHHREG
ncbi:porin PorA family protein [uncultured Corynebacterium sp.]|uniref:porin PorA family protein n=1 Tax=uncultured Corynebacterium sp. TaxID=159447 RepID=UPI00262A86C2|nr:porin PorA family protein [uncultured Corynebacterium sp.]